MSDVQSVNELAPKIESLLIQGDLGKLTIEERIQYNHKVCASLGLNPLTKPFDYITLNGKLTLYARKDATDQLRRIYNISIEIVDRAATEGVYAVTARARTPDGRTDESMGAVPITGLKGADLANALMKAETKAKRRATLSICGLGMLDESERDTLPKESQAVEQVRQAITERPKAVPLPKGDEEIEVIKAKDPQDDLYFGGPIHCGRPMMISKFQDATYYCPTCRTKIPFSKVQS